MSITLDDLTLPDDLYWQDEFDWSPVSQSITPTITGALIVEENVFYEGREITLVSGDTFGWAPHSLVSQLRSKESQINPVMTLGINGETRTVIWRRDPIAVEVKPLIQMVDPDDHDFYLLTLRFTEMSE